MDSVNALLQKLQLLAQNPTPSAIDQDLMLTYTRRLYDLLLSQGSRPKTATTAVAPKEVTPPVQAPLNLPVEAADGQQTNTTDPIFGQEENIKPEAPLTIDIPNEVSSLSFELPRQPETPHSSPKAGIEEEPVEQPATPTLEIPVPLDDQEKQQFAVYENPSQTDSSNLKKTDIRKRIGINDKYLFLNELFNNKKKEYEAALDQINTFTNFIEAKTWITQNPAQNFNWSREDETVGNFYELVEKYFSFK